MAKRKKGAEVAEKKGAEGAEEKDTTTDAEGGGSKKKFVLIPVIVIVLAAVGGGAMAGGFIGGGGDGAEAAEAEPEATETPAELGTLLELESVTINLAGGHFLKLGVAVELSADAAGDETPATAPIYDAMIDQFSPMTIEALSDPGTREGTKTSLLASLASVYGEDIVNVYFTEFVMQ